MKFSVNNQVELFEPPVPRARRSIRNINITENNSSYISKNSDNISIKNNMHKIEQQNHNFHNSPNNNIQYTDDEECDDDDNDNDDDDEIFNDKLLNTSQDSLLLEYFSSTGDSPARTPVYKQNSLNLNTNQSINTIRNSFSSYKVQNQSTEGLFTKSNIVLCIVILLVVSSIGALLHKDEVNQKTVMDIKKVDLADINNLLSKSIQIIKSQFQNQKVNIWNDISAGIYDVALFPTKPSIIILFGTESDTLNCLAQLLGELSGNILGSNDYLMLTPEDFPNDVGQVIHNLKVKIIQKKAVIVQDLLSINTEAIKAFHNFCDREMPLVKHAIYIITIIVDEYKSSQRELEFVENQIFKRLSKHVDKDILNPLITRITDGVIVPVLPESSRNFNYAGCSSYK